MTSPLPDRFRSWLADVFLGASVGQAAGAMADATRWGWLPALSGIAVGGDHARSAHGGEAQAPQQAGHPGTA